MDQQNQRIFSLLEGLRDGQDGLRDEIKEIREGQNKIIAKVDILTQDSVERDIKLKSMEERLQAQEEKNSELEISNAALQNKYTELGEELSVLREDLGVFRINLQGIGGNLDYLTAAQMRTADEVSDAIEFVATLKEAKKQREDEEFTQAWEQDKRNHPEAFARMYGDPALHIDDLDAQSSQIRAGVTYRAEQQGRSSAAERGANQWASYTPSIAPGLGDTSSAPQRGMDSTLRFAHNGATSPGPRSMGGGRGLKHSEFEALCYPKSEGLSLSASMKFVTAIGAYNGDPNKASHLFMAHMFYKPQKDMLIAFFGLEGLCVVGDQSYLALFKYGGPPEILTNAQVIFFLQRHAATAAMTPLSFCAMVKANAKYDGPKTVTASTWPEFLQAMLSFTSRVDEVVSFLTLPPGHGQNLPILSMREGGLLNVFFNDMIGVSIYNAIGRDFVTRFLTAEHVQQPTFSTFAGEWSKHIASAYKAHMLASGYVVTADNKPMATPVAGPAVHAIDDDPYLSPHMRAALLEWWDHIDTYILTHKDELVCKDESDGGKFLMELKPVPKICFEYFRGRCYKGESCKYSHLENDMIDYRQHLSQLLEDNHKAYNKPEKKAGPQPKFSMLKRPDDYVDRRNEV